jgi:hypothetical protein
VFLVVNGRYGIGGRGIGDIGIKRRLLLFSQQVVDRPTLLWLLGILMTAKPSPHSHVGHCRTCARPAMPSPLYLDEPTSSACPGMSVWCQ